MSKRAIIIASIALLAVAGTAIAYKVKSGKPKGINVQVESVGRKQVVQKVTATGRVQPTTQVNISADVSAKIIRLHVKEGDKVEKGQILLELDRERLSAALDSAKANLSSAQSNARAVEQNMNKVQKDFERMQDLQGQALESQAALDAARATYESERARHRSSLDGVEQARAALKQTEDELSKTTIYAPIGGTVSQLKKEEGEIALGSQFNQDIILVLSNLSGMEALVDVDENDIVNISLDDAADIEVDALQNVVFHGVVTEIANSAKVSATGTTDQKTEFEVKIAITDATPALRPGMTASAEITVETRNDAIAVPIQAVAVRTPQQLLAEPKGGPKGEKGGPGGGGPPAQAADAKPASEATPAADGKFTPNKQGFVEAVFVIKDGKAEARQVKTGIQSENAIEILDGLAEGEQVVIGTYRAIAEQLRDGAEVSVGPAEGGPGGPGAEGGPAGRR